MKALEQLQRLKGPPSVQMQDVPRESVGQHLGFSFGKDEEPRDELDDNLARQFTLIVELISCDLLASLHRAYKIPIQHPRGRIDR